MSGWPDSGWLRTILGAKTSVYAFVALACVVVLLLAVLDVPYLGVVTLGVFAVALFLSRMWDAKYKRWQKDRREREILVQLDHLSGSEEALLRHQVERNKPTFSISLNSPDAAALRGKGLLKLCSPEADLQGGHLHAIPDFVWRELKRRWPAPEPPEPPETRSEDVRSALRRARAGGGRRI